MTGEVVTWEVKDEKLPEVMQDIIDGKTCLVSLVQGPMSLDDFDIMELADQMEKCGVPVRSLDF